MGRQCGFYQPPNIKDSVSNKYSSNLCDFLSKMIIWDFSERWSARQLLNHSFLTNKSTKLFIKNMNVRKKENDLSFMVKSLIEYYSNTNFYDFKNKKEQKEKKE